MKKLLAITMATFLLTTSSIAQEVTAKDRFIQFITDTYRISNASTIVDVVLDVSKAKNLDPTLVFAIIAVESGFKEKARSPMAAVGLMQVHYPAHKSKVSKKSDLYDIETNVDIGTDIWIACTSKAKTLKLAARCYTGGHAEWLAKVQRNQTKFNTIYKEFI